MHAFRPSAAENLPAEHCKHSPVTNAHLPAVQLEQYAEPSAPAYFPGLQAAQDEDPGAEYDSTGHGIHDARCPIDWVPAGQGAHVMSTDG